MIVISKVNTTQTRRFEIRSINLTTPEIYKKASKTGVFRFLSGYNAQSGTVANSLITPSFSSNVFSSLGISVIRLCAGLPPDLQLADADALEPAQDPGNFALLPAGSPFF